MRKWLAVILAVVFVVGLSAGAWAKAKVFTFGCAVPLSGLFGKAGAQVKDAYTYWAEKVNGRGGILVKGKRYKVKLIFYDDQSNPQTSRKLVEKLITRDKVDLLLGGYASSQVMAASAAAERHQYPYISGGASSNILFKRGFKYYFATLGKATEEVKGAVDVFTAVKPRPKTVAIVAANIPFCALAAQGFKKYALKNGMKVVHFELFPIRLQDYNTMLGKAKAKKPDLLLVGSHLGVAIRVIKAMREINFSPMAVAFSYGPTVPAFAKALGKQAEYVFAASEWTPNLPYKGPVLGTAAAFNQGYKKRFGRYPDYVEAAAAAGAVVQQMCIQKLGITPGVTKKDRVRLMKCLHGIKAKTFYGKVNFGADGANVAHPPVAIQIQKGKVVNVFPRKAASGKPWFPMPAWNKR
jgi:branched-chain amino acid transport system substrate-binding protein